jgi:hypothetical protein
MTNPDTAQQDVTDDWTYVYFFAARAAQELGHNLPEFHLHANFSMKSVT